MRALLLCSLLLVGCGATLVDHLEVGAVQPPPPPGGCNPAACPGVPNASASCESQACFYECSAPYLKCGPSKCCLPKTVAAGGNTTCAVLDDRTVSCWGAPLGSAAPASAVPALIDGLAPVTAVAVGVSHACAIVSGGSVRCWGDNLEGQLGQPGATRSAIPLAPVPGVSGAVEISLGDRHSCARTPGGVMCWGANEVGQLGDGTQSSRTGAVSVLGISTVTAIAAGFNHNCAVLGNGVSCWGAGESGQIGDGSNPPAQTEPAPVKFSGGSVGAVSVAAGWLHSCALFTSSLACWGKDNQGQLGDGSTTDRSTPRQITLASPTVIAAGRAHTCAAAGIGGNQLYCWGANNHGQLGTGDTISQTIPTLTSTGQVQSLALGADHGCALQTTGQLLCWGNNTQGQTGVASTALSIVLPAPVTGR